MKNIRHIIWDWNGTLFNDVELCLEIINEVLARRKINPLSFEEYRKIFTFPVQLYYEKAGLDFNKHPFDVLGREWMEEYERRKKECSLHEGASDALKIISQKGISQSILSAYSQQTLEEIVGYFGIREYFTHMMGLDHIYATSKIENGKRLIRMLGNGEDETLFIGDTVHDFEVAKEIGAECILVAGGHQDKGKLESCNVPVFGTLKDIPFHELLK